VPSTREIRRRIRSVSNTEQITKAMEMVAASRMRRAQMTALAGRPYSEKIRDVLSHLAGFTADSAQFHPLLEKRKVKAIGVVLITADRGLCGALNSNVIRLGYQYMTSVDVPTYITAIGRRGLNFVRRHGGCTLHAEFHDLGDRPSMNDATAINQVLLDGYLSGLFDEVHVVYTQFHSTLVQRPVRFRLLPVDPPAEKPRYHQEYIYEPSAGAVLEQLLPRYCDGLIYQSILEGLASEHSARMVAMRNATESAGDIVHELTLHYNKARQESITKELLEIASGAQALG
jgi:F-type H+-transporting ATPase subunit gamma